MASKVFNRRQSKTTRQRLRQQMPAPEQQLWRRIRACQIGEKFRRQHGIGPYIVDFYCPALALVIEVDGDSHFIDDQAIARDRKRQEYLTGLGLRVIRYTNRDIRENLEGVLQDLQEKMQALRATPPQPSP